MTDLPSDEAVHVLYEAHGWNMPMLAIVRTYLHRTNEGRALVRDAAKWRAYFVPGRDFTPAEAASYSKFLEDFYRAEDSANHD